MFWQSLSRKRILLEDALKHIYDCEYRKVDATTHSLAGALGLRSRKAIALVDKLEERGLVHIAGNGLHLTSHGRAWALQVIRAHRLWESYLSVEVGVPLERIHEQAERKEHNITPAQADVLDAHLGYPLRDPHGDPIPSASHKLERVRGVPLTDWPVGKLGRIVHVEDEPQMICKQIFTEGLFLDTDVKILESAPRGFHLWSRGHECWLPPVVVANIYVKESPQGVEGIEDSAQQILARPLSALMPGESGRIVTLKCQGLTRRRFLDLGLLPGTWIEVMMPSAFSQPLAYKIRETMIALRREQAEQILIEPFK
jgi:DtxR family Mn-dependent transcriptional regulator